MTQDNNTEKNKSNESTVLGQYMTQDNNTEKNKSNESTVLGQYMGYYIPHRIWITIGLFFALLYGLREKISESFSHSMELNSVIAVTIGIVIIMNITNILKFHDASKLINRITQALDTCDFEEYEVVQKKVMQKGNILDSFPMRQVLKKSFDKNKLLFDDKSAILIKSKVGGHANAMRSGITFLTGILVMLGLIGTFWGMLDTLKSVGDVLTALGTSLDSGNGDGIASLIQSIAKPISGMGTAFSTSLFGLVGSLFGNILNSFVSKGIDKFIVDFGYWVDTHIPLPNEIAKAGVASLGAKKDNNNSNTVAKDGSDASQKVNISDGGLGFNKDSAAGYDGHGFNAIAQEIKRSTEMQEHFMKQIMEFTSTQLYASNTLQQSLLSLNSVQNKGVQISYSQKTLLETSYMEIQKLKSVIIAIANQCEGIYIDSNDYHIDNASKLQETLDLLKQEFLPADITAFDEDKNSLLKPQNIKNQ